MIDRASTFANEEMAALLRERFVPVAIDQAYERRQQDAEGEFYRKFAGQGPRKDFKGTTQGFYVATADGELLLYNNNRDPAKVRRLVARALQQFDASPAAKREVAAIDPGRADPRWAVAPPEGGLVVRAHGKVLGGYAPTESWTRRAMQQALSRDNLWITAQEHAALVKGELPERLLVRIARYHLVDNTRGEPGMWRPEHVRELAVRRDGDRIEGRVRLASEDGARSYDAQVLGFVATTDGKVTRFDLVALGTYEGEGRYTRGAPDEPFPYAVSLRLADGRDTADAVPPQGSRGWLQGYLRAERR